MRSLALLLPLLFSLIGLPAHAGCEGTNILATMPPEESAELRARADAQPFARGNFWQARREDQMVTLVGTYHLGDARHDATLAAIAPHLDKAATILVEAGPEEEAALMARMTNDPSLMVMSDASLRDILPPEEWEALAAALTTRGIPPFMGAKFQPWYVTLLLAIPACQLADAQLENGLDARIIEFANAKGTPLRALEPFDTVFRIFDAIPREDQIALIRSTLAMEDRAEDFAVTLADTYFAGESRLIWELMRYESLRLPGYTPEEVEQDLAVMEEAMINARNRAWISVIEEAAAQGPVLAAFGALHLPGAEGVPNLLQANGWTLTPLPMP
ncbi:MAG: TraB/GumN family protein [Cypionkella sp.]|jgi:hypothetical protein|nr:TraB/GumN family protein [Cypionkella sp.]